MAFWSLLLVLSRQSGASAVGLVSLRIELQYRLLTLLVGWTGPTTCVSGLVCTVLNPYYSQCLPGTAQTTTSATSKSSTSSIISSTKTTSISTLTTTTKTSASATVTPPTGKFKWLGVDESGAEFGSSSYPGVWGKDFIFPSTSSLDVCPLPSPLKFELLGLTIM